MKILICTLVLALLAGGCTARHSSGSDDDRESLKRTTRAIRDAFGRGDVDAIVALHHPNVVKYFGGNNIVVGREGLRQQLTGWLRDNNVEFTENRIGKHSLQRRDSRRDLYLRDQIDSQEWRTARLCKRPFHGRLYSL